MDIFFDILIYIKLQIENNYFLSLSLFFTVIFIYNSLSLPGHIFFIAAAGYFYGLYIGFLISIISLVFGSLFFFIFCKFIFKKYFSNIFKKYTNNINKYISDSTLEYLIIFRILPGPPLFIQNLLLSILNVNKYFFIFSTFLGFTPLVFLIVSFGSHLNKFENLKKISLSNFITFEFLIFLTILIFLISLRIFFKKIKH